MNNLTFDQRKWLLKQYWKTENARLVREAWQVQFQTPPPSRQAIYKLRDKFERDGSVGNKKKTGRNKTSSTEDNEITVAQTFVNSPTKSTRRAAAELAMPRTSLRRLMKNLKLKPYRPRLLHGLLEDDPDRRVQFCETLRDLIDNDDPNILNKIVWTDEASFKMNGHVNRHNCVYWADKNPNKVIEKQSKIPGVTVWGVISSDGIIGPFFFEGTVNGTNYLNMLQTAAMPQLTQRADFGELWFMQDGAPPHYSLQVRAFLDQTFPNRWIGRRGSIEWSPRSPDFTPMDFFLWGVVKEMVFSRKPENVQQMRQFITDAFADIGRDITLIHKVCQSVGDRLQECVNVDGGLFEHLRD